MKVESFTVSRKLVLKAVDDFLSTIIRKASDHFCGRLGRVKVTLCTVLLSLLAAFPQYRGLSQQLDQGINIQALLIKFHNPLSPIPPELKDVSRYYGEGSHNDKLELRLTLPILGWLGHTGKWTVVIWNHLSALVVFFLLAKLSSQALDDDVGGALFVLALGPTFFGSWFFSDIHFGDGIAFMLLLLSIASRNLVLSSFWFLAAAFEDERCVLAVPLVLLYFAISLPGNEEKTLRRKHYIAILFGVGMWMLLRYWVAQTYHLATGTSMLGMRSIIRDNLTGGFPYVFLDTFKVSWTIPLFAVMCLALKRKWAVLSVYVASFAFLFVPALLVIDFDRSICYTFIFLLTSLYFLRGGKEPARKYLAAILVLNVLLISPGSSILRIGIW